jgi:catechol 2,3-dioxygenase-like lactoylglutathione lyase family enzyme
MASFAVKSIDHVVLTCRNIPATINFYTQRLGMRHEVFTSKGVER